MNVGEHGIAYNLNVNYVLSAATSLSLTITRPDGTSVTRTGGDVTAPAVALVTGTQFGTFAVSQYAKYIIQPGDLNQVGVYTARLTYVDGTKLLKSDLGEYSVFTVGA
jgi:hypothetical protein